MGNACGDTGMYLEQRYRKFYACHDMPEDAQKTLGRRRFVKSLNTEDQFPLTGELRRGFSLRSLDTVTEP